MGGMIFTILSDNELLGLVAEGRTDAFEQLMLRYESQVYSFALKFLKNEAIAQEITQDIFIELWNNRNKITAISSLPAWLYTISRNKSFNTLKEIANRHVREEAFATSGPLTADLEDIVHGRDYDRLLDRLIEQLPQKRREIFRLKITRGWTNDQIGEHLQISANTVKNQLAKSYQSLRKELSEVLTLVIICGLLK